MYDIGRMTGGEIMSSKFIKCPCCGEGMLEDTYDVCLVCGWENDPIQNEMPDFSGGANKDSLNEHKRAFRERRNSDPKYLWCNTWRR